MTDSSTENVSNDQVVEGATLTKHVKNHPPLSSLRNPTWEFLHNNYTKNELQKYCSQLQIGGIWTTKEKLIDKLITHYSSLNRSPSSSSVLTSGDNQDRVIGGSSMTELIERFETFVRETNDNFYVVNNSLAEKEKEINELKTKVFLAEEKIKSLQEELRISNGGLQENTATLSESKTLLIGDSCLQEIRYNDLHDNVIVRTLPEANMALVKSWIAEKLNHSLKECIIYCGIQDLLDDETSIDEVLDGLGTIVADLKRKYDDISVKVCELVPSLKSDELVEKNDQYNAKLSIWCKDNGVIFIETNKYFRLGTGDIDGNCYDSHDNSDCDSLSRIGAIRLLDAISSVCQRNFVCSNWKEVKQNVFGVNNGRNKSLALNKGSSGNIVTNSNVRNGRSSYQIENHYSTSNVNRNHDPISSTTGWSDYRYNRVDRSQVNTNVHYSQNRNSTINRNRRGCFNCGEFNHRQNNCRYDHKVKCNVCQEYGHKSRFCSYNYR